MSWLALLAAVVAGEAAPAPAVAPAPPPSVAAQPAAPAAQPLPDGEDGPPASNAQAGVGEAQILTSFQSAESARGALDGRWRLTLANGQALYLFEFSDSGGAPDARATTPMAPQIEGSWRDLSRADALDGSGMFETVQRDGGKLSIVFYEGHPAQTETFTLHPATNGWSGEQVAGDTRTPVLMTRQ